MRCSVVECRAVEENGRKWSAGQCRQEWSTVEYEKEHAYWSEGEGHHRRVHFLAEWQKVGFLVLSLQMIKLVQPEFGHYDKRTKRQKT